MRKYSVPTGNFRLWTSSGRSCRPWCVNGGGRRAWPAEQAEKIRSVIVDVSMSSRTVQITMTAADPGDPAKGRYVTVALPRDALAAAMASASARPIVKGELGLRVVKD